MWNRRITYLCALVASSLLYIMYPLWIAQYLWVLVLLVLPFDLLISLPGLHARRISLAVPSILQQGEEQELVIATESLRRFPSGLLKARLYTTRGYRSTGESADKGTASYIRISCSPQDGSRFTVPVNTSTCEAQLFEVSRLWTCSIMGLFALPSSAGCRAIVVILPAPVEPPLSVQLSEMLDFSPRPGSAYAEDYELRSYRVGDPINTMHWKLSAKFDSPIVREYTGSPTYNRLICLAAWEGPAEHDLILGRLCWCSSYLLERNFPFIKKYAEEY